MVVVLIWSKLYYITGFDIDCEQSVFVPEKFRVVGRITKCLARKL